MHAAHATPTTSTTKPTDKQQTSCRLCFIKGYTLAGFAEKVFHIHLRTIGDSKEIYFRDYLNSHADAARDYEALKLSLWKQFEHDRDGYTNAKSEFVNRYTAIATNTQANGPR